MITLVPQRPGVYYTTVYYDSASDIQALLPRASLALLTVSTIGDTALSLSGIGLVQNEHSLALCDSLRQSVRNCGRNQIFTLPMLNSPNQTIWFAVGNYIGDFLDLQMMQFANVVREYVTLTGNNQAAIFFDAEDLNPTFTRQLEQYMGDVACTVYIGTGERRITDMVADHYVVVPPKDDDDDIPF